MPYLSTSGQSNSGGVDEESTRMTVGWLRTSRACDTAVAACFSLVASVASNTEKCVDTVGKAATALGKVLDSVGTVASVCGEWVQTMSPKERSTQAGTNAAQANGLQERAPTPSLNALQELLDGLGSSPYSEPRSLTAGPQSQISRGNVSSIGSPRQWRLLDNGVSPSGGGSRGQVSDTCVQSVSGVGFVQAWAASVPDHLSVREGTSELGDSSASGSQDPDGRTSTIGSVDTSHRLSITSVMDLMMDCLAANTT
ncbi:hypothetical protein BCR39DRAFT_560228 [Naematelia encephala]|uniref:Uncharacterized protein n=1 Tax=Naematelia encephala TaxID=71784 RepID=A0A1Y2AXJ9_9TREE|nr:hypothetical protein BCR39DRAFT_560228 [Naematelia encephala]